MLLGLLVAVVRVLRLSGVDVNNVVQDIDVWLGLAELILFEK
jgi:hypothetical protein